MDNRGDQPGKGRTKGYSPLRADRPSARRVHEPAALPERDAESVERKRGSRHTDVTLARRPGGGLANATTIHLGSYYVVEEAQVIGPRIASRRETWPSQ